MSYLTLHHFGLPANAMAAQLATGDQVNAIITVGGAIDNAGYAVIVGPRGVGKSFAIKAAIDAKQMALKADPKTRNKEIKIVEPLNPDKERMKIGTILDAIVYDLSDESPKRGEARMRQIRPILGEAAKNGHVVLWIRESHRLHPATVRSLKSLMELTWMGRGPLLSIVLDGQKDPTTLPSLEEVGKRAKDGRMAMAGLSEAEATVYIRGTVGSVWTEEAVAALAAAKVARNYLDLQEALVAAMDQALAEGRKRVELSDVFNATGVGLKAMAQQVGVSLAEIGKAIGKDKSQVSRIMDGEREDPDAKARIQKMLADRAGKQAPAQEEPGRKVANG